MELNRKVGRHFKLWEFVTSQTAERAGIDNTPSETVVQNIELLCKNILDPARDALGELRVSSGFRCKELNTLVGGSDTSGHVYGYCADILPLRASKLDFARWVKNNVPFDQLILEFGTLADPAWIHVSADLRHRKEVYRILKGTGYVPIVL